MKLRSPNHTLLTDASLTEGEAAGLVDLLAAAVFSNRRVAVYSADVGPVITTGFARSASIRSRPSGSASGWC